MTPHRAGDKKGLRGSFIIDRRTRVGRIAVASGTNRVPTFKRLNEMLTALNETGRDDILRAIRDGDLLPLSVYDAFRSNELHRLPLGKELLPLKETMTLWNQSAEVSKQRKADNKSGIKRLSGKVALVANLPDALIAVRSDLAREQHPAQFNRIRATALAFVRDSLKRSHRLYGEVRDVPLMKEVRAPERHTLSWAEMQEKAGKLTDARDRAAFYGMVMTGMGPKEWYVDGWKLGDGRVTIYGAKRKSRSRIVPALYHGGYFCHPLPPSDVARPREQRRFGERLLHLVSIRPYDLRRTYANWLEAAGVPRTRRKSYLGHAGGDVTSLYERHEVAQFLAEDARRIEAYLALAPITSHITLASGEAD